MVVSNKIQIFKVSDFLGWQRAGSLTLSPSFQRRPVWNSPAKSFLIDSIARQLPVPLIFLRERIKLTTQSTLREVVDGQQRLRTLFTYIDPACLNDLDPKRDGFEVLSKHNPDLADKAFGSLPTEMQRSILGYEFGTYVLPAETEDRDVLRIFARLNSTGVRLNGQELRNADYHGDLKQLMYQLALEQLDRWRSWGVFDEDSIARMAEVEFISDVTLSMTEGAVTGKTQKRLDNLYKRNDNAFASGAVVATRVRKVMDTINDLIGGELADTVFDSPVNFYSLWILVYDLHYGIASDMKRGTQPNPIRPQRFRRAILDASDRIRSERVPEEVLDAIRRASSDTGRRQQRHDFLKQSYA